MGKRIRINGKLYESVSPRNRSRRVRFMNESYGKKVTSRDLYYKYGLYGTDMPWGPIVAQTIGNYEVFVLGDDETNAPEVYPMVYIQSYDDEDEPEYSVYSKDGTYSNDQDGYDRAVDDFEDICKALDRGDTLPRVANRFHLSMDRM